MHTFTVIVLHVIIAVANTQTYRAGVILYKPIEDAADTPDEKLQKNVNNVITLIKSNKDKADIFVLPEYGLTNIQAKSVLKGRLEAYSTKIGKVGDNVCLKNGTTPDGNLLNVACAAKDSNAYIIVNLIENDGDHFYVTNVGFDPKGVICLKCRKQHLTNGTAFEKASDQNSCSFNATIKNEAPAKFSVLFGTDVLYPIPEALKTENVIITSSIMNNLPLSFGVSMYQGFAVSNGVNLLVADYSDNENNYGGSGIFDSDGISVVAFSSAGVPGASDKGAVLIKEVPLKPKSSSVINVQSTNVGQVPKMKLQYMNILAINETAKVVDKCLEKRCCHFKSEITTDSISPYKWIVLQNKTTILDQEMDIFLCALVVPSANFPATSFKNISISSNIEKSETLLTLPITLNQNFLPTNFIFNRDTRSIALSKEENVVLFGIIEVLGGSNVPSSGTNTTLIVVIVLLGLVLVALIVAFLIWRKRQAKNRRNF